MFNPEIKKYLKLCVYSHDDYLEKFKNRTYSNPYSSLLAGNMYATFLSSLTVENKRGLLVNNILDCAFNNEANRFFNPNYKRIDIEKINDKKFEDFFEKIIPIIEHVAVSKHIAVVTHIGFLYKEKNYSVKNQGYNISKTLHAIKKYNAAHLIVEKISKSKFRKQKLYILSEDKNFVPMFIQSISQSPDKYNGEEMLIRNSGFIQSCAKCFFNGDIVEYKNTK